MALTRTDLDQMQCGDPGCTASPLDHDEMFFHSACHPTAPAWVSYLDGVVTVSCAECGSAICAVGVAN